MISTALAIQEATQEAVHDEGVMEHAAHLLHSRTEATEEEFVRMLFQYSAHLSAMTSTLVTHACLTESQIRDLINTIEEMETMGKDVE